MTTIPNSLKSKGHDIEIYHEKLSSWSSGSSKVQSKITLPIPIVQEAHGMQNARIVLLVDINWEQHVLQQIYNSLVKGICLIEVPSHGWKYHSGNLNPSTEHGSYQHHFSVNQQKPFSKTATKSFRGLEVASSTSQRMKNLENCVAKVSACTHDHTSQETELHTVM